MKKYDRILVIKPSSFGDIVQANPTLVALKRCYPGVRIDWLVFDRWIEIVRLFPDVDTVISWNRNGGIREFVRIVRLLRKTRYDLVIDLQGLLRSALMAVMSGAKQKIGVPGMKELSRFLINEVPALPANRNAVMRSLDVVRYLTGENAGPVFSLAVPADVDREAGQLLEAHGLMPNELLVGIVPSVRGNAKKWPAAHYRAAADTILERFSSARLLSVGGAEDAGLFRNSTIIDLCGKTSLPLLAALLKRCRVVFGGDTGPIHLAAALGIPVVAIFGGSDVKETAPVPQNATIITKNLSCAPCRGRARCDGYPCLREISPEVVVGAIERWIR